MAIAAAMAATTRPTGPVRNVKADDNPLTTDVIFEMIAATGEIAATSPATMRIVFCVVPLRLENHWRTFVTLSASFCSAGSSCFASDAPICVIDILKVLFSFWISSSSSAAPSAASFDIMSPASSASSPYFFSASPPSSMIPERSIADLPKISIARASRSVSFSTLLRALSASYQTSVTSLISPFASYIDTPSLSNTSDPELIFMTSFFREPVI